MSLILRLSSLYFSQIEMHLFKSLIYGNKRMEQKRKSKRKQVIIIVSAMSVCILNSRNINSPILVHLNDVSNKICFPSHKQTTRTNCHIPRCQLSLKTLTCKFFYFMFSIHCEQTLKSHRKWLGCKTKQTRDKIANHFIIHTIVFIFR